jgi:hypothetical protein
VIDSFNHKEAYSVNCYSNITTEVILSSERSITADAAEP